jgi:hypothetical protein
VFSTTANHRRDQVERYGDIQHRIVTDDEPFGGMLVQWNDLILELEH